MTSFDTDLARRWAERLSGQNAEAVALAGVPPDSVIVAGHFDYELRGPGGSRLGRPSLGKRDAFVAERSRSCTPTDTWS